MRYIVLGRAPALLDNVLSCFHSHQRPFCSETQELSGKGRLHTTDDGTVPLARESTPQPPPDSQRPV